MALGKLSRVIVSLLTVVPSEISYILETDIANSIILGWILGWIRLRVNFANVSSLINVIKNTFGACFMAYYELSPNWAKRLLNQFYEVISQFGFFFSKKKILSNRIVLSLMELIAYEFSINSCGLYPPKHLIF